MDRDDLMRLMKQYDDGDLAVDVDGYVRWEDADGDAEASNVCDIEAALEAALSDLEDDIARMRKLIAWAKLAPEYQPPPVTTRDEGGKLFDDDGLPL